YFRQRRADASHSNVARGTDLMLLIRTNLTSLAMLLSLVGCAASQVPTAQVPSPTPFPTPTHVPPTATTSSRCVLYETFLYPTPFPTRGIAFKSRPEPANNNAVYTGVAIYTGLVSGLSVVEAVFITNSGNDAIPVDVSDFDARPWTSGTFSGPTPTLYWESN